MEKKKKKYRELLELIDKGAKQDPKHFEALKKNAEDELQTIKNINEDA